MCKKIFIAATGQHTGKTTISISLMHLARKKYPRVGFIKPIGPKCVPYHGVIMDTDAALMASIYDLNEDIRYMSPVVLPRGTTKRYLDRELSTDHQKELLVVAIRELEQRYDLLIIEGSGHGGVGSILGLNNAQVAKLADAPVLMVTNGGIGNVVDSVELNLALYEKHQAHVRMLLINKLVPEMRRSTLGYLQKAFSGSSLKVSGAFDYSRILANPTLQSISRLLTHPLHGNTEGRNRIVHNIHLGAASSQTVIDHLMDSTLLITTSSRDELLVTASSLYNIPTYRDKIAGLVIPGHSPVSAITQSILDESGIPYIRIHNSTAEVYSALLDHVSKITAEDTEKLDLLRSSAESYINFQEIDELF
jgi:BioD-like phosphotransacetylase family protein